MAHILLLPSWYPETSNDVKGVFFRDQGLALAQYGQKVGVIAVNMRSLRTLGLKASGKSSPTYELDEGIPTYRSRIWDLPRAPYGNYLLWKRSAAALFKQYVKNHGWPDLIHAHSLLYAGAVAAEWGRKYNLPVVLTEHSTGFARGVYRPWQLDLAEKAAAGADACIAVSPALGHLLGERLPSSAGRWAWVPNVVAFRFHEGANLREPESSRPVRFLNLALMTDKKGQKDLLDAFMQVFGTEADTEELWLGGDGPLLETLQSRARELGIESRVRFLGRVPPEEVPALLSKVDVMVVASHYETFGVVAAEALMAGVPVVATRCGGPECIVGEGDGRLVPPRDPGALARALTEVADELPYVDRHAIAKRARQRFSGDAVVGQLTQIYEQVLAGRPMAARRL